MRIIESFHDVQPSDQQSVIAIGNFDGVHRGHKALMNEAQQIAAEYNTSMSVLTFEPHPRQLFQPDQPPARLTPVNVKAKLLKDQGVDRLISLPFTWDFASQSAQDFVQKILIGQLNAAHIVIGDDFCFGQLRQGNAQTIKDHGLPVTIVPPVLDSHDKVISSSRIRQLIRIGDIKTANELLGYDWTIEGKIFRGDRRGHDLGYPTANILLEDTIHPAYGVYACLVKIEGEDQWRMAATNIGIRPMFEVTQGQVEAHILDFPDIDIYNQTLTVKPIKRLRGEAKFNSIDELIEQMARDCIVTRELFNSSGA